MMSNEQVNRARRTALVLGTSLSISLIAIVYAVLQKKEAARQRSLAIEMEIRTRECEKNVYELNSKLNSQTQQLQQVLKEAEQRVLLLQEQGLAKSKGNK